MRRRSLVPVLAVLAAHPAAAHALGFVSLPGNVVAYDFEYATMGTFGCAGVYPPLSCLASGNTITLTSGGRSLTLTFQGASGTAEARNAGPLSLVNVGTLTQTVTGDGPFTFPGSLPSGGPVFRMSLGMSSTAPLPFASAAVPLFGFLLTPTSFSLAPNIEFGGYTNLAPPIAPAPNGVGRYGIYMEFVGLTPTSVGAPPVQYTMFAALIPEPTTYLLVGTGLLALGLVARRRA